jgi:hypothetical protein
MKNEKGFVNFLLIAVAIVIIGGGTFYYASYQNPESSSEGVDLNESFPVINEDGDNIDNSKKTNELENNTVQIINPNGTEEYSSSQNIVVEWWDDTVYGSKDIYVINKNGEEVVADKNMSIRSSGIDDNFRYKILDDLNSGEYKIKVCKSGTNDCDTTSEFITVNKKQFSETRTYLDSEYSFSFDYPVDYSISKDENKVFLLFPTTMKGSGQDIVLTIEMREISLEDFIKEYENQSEFNTIYGKEKIKISENNAISFTAESSYGLGIEYIFIEKDGLAYIIRHSNHESHIEVINTFNFTD